MSLINKMLQDLDKRHATDSGGKKTITEQLRPVRTPKDWRRIAWEVGAGLVIGGGWAAWVMLQVSPHSVVTELAFAPHLKRPQLAAGPQAPQPVPAQASTPTPIPVPASAPVLPSAPAQPAPQPAEAATAPTPAPAEAAGKEAKFAGVDMLRLATEIRTPFKEKGGGAGDRSERKPAGASAPKSRTAHQTETAAIGPAGRTPATGAQDRISIDMHASSPAERAESEFRKATDLLNRGRVAEAIDGYKSTLQQDARHAAARQALVGLLLDGRRIDEAQQYLQEGLSVDPNRFAYAILLARIQVDRGDLQGAHDLLQKHAASAAGDAEYHAFDAAVLQRLGRHQEAVASYQAALKLAPRAGLWWMGMGISLQAEHRGAEALSAFQRAKSVGGLNPDLVAFVDQRVKQLQ